jgi:acyl-CoA reductase-like NAD-dependent aldehyde dehydrogenase
VDAAVAAARAAYEGPWRTFSATHSGRLLSTFAQVVRDHAEEIAWLETRNVDKPISGSRGEAQGVANTVEFYGGTANDLHGGGYKLPGVGHELGMHALDLCTEVKNVFVDLRVVGRGA